MLQLRNLRRSPAQFVKLPKCHWSERKAGLAKRIGKFVEDQLKHFGGGLELNLPDEQQAQSIIGCGGKVLRRIGLQGIAVSLDGSGRIAARFGSVSCEPKGSLGRIQLSRIERLGRRQRRTGRREEQSACGID